MSISDERPVRGRRRTTGEHLAITGSEGVPSAAVADRRAELASIWRRIDLHIHTPASADFQQAGVSPLDILLKAEERGLDVLAFTDHNSVRGYADLWREIEDLELLECLKRMTPAEEARLREYRRLLATVLLLPGFEFTATFGFHILAIFPEATTVRMMEHLLLTLGVAEERFGSGEVGATTDVLAAYRILSDHGALVIGAHVNSANGVAMHNLPFGGQTKIAYTQDDHLHALEVTDLATPANRRSTARFFNGSKAEYPRRMHCIQGSDAHRLDRDPDRASNLGIGERATDVLLPAVSFGALKAVFLGNDFTRTRASVYESSDAVKSARREGNTHVQAFHEGVANKRTGYGNVLRDIVAFANGDGGTVYVGASAFEKRPIAGVPDAATAAEDLRAEIRRSVTPVPSVEIEVLESDGKTVLAVRVPAGPARPYALSPGHIFVRREAESVAANRDEIVRLVREAVALQVAPSSVALVDAAASGTVTEAAPAAGRRRRRRVTRRATADAPVGDPSGTVASLPPSTAGAIRPIPHGIETPDDGPNGVVALGVEESSEQGEEDAISPRTGVEIVSSSERDGVVYYTLRDLRNSQIFHDVTRETSRRLWRYAIQQREAKTVEEGHIRWKGDLGFWKTYRPHRGELRYNLAYRGDEDLRIFYGVSAEGMDDRWQAVLPDRRQTASS